jgi:hypothetical protein
VIATLIAGAACVLLVAFIVRSVIVAINEEDWR